MTNEEIEKKFDVLAEIRRYKRNEYARGLKIETLQQEGLILKPITSLFSKKCPHCKTKLKKQKKIIDLIFYACESCDYEWVICSF